MPLPVDYSSPDRKKWLQEAADMGARALRYQTYSLAYDADEALPPLMLTDRLRAFLETSGVAWHENFLGMIIDTFTDETRVKAFQVDGNDAASKWLQDVAWHRNQMDERQGVTHHEHYKYGDAFVAVDFDEDAQLPTYRRLDPRRTKAVYGEDDSLLYVVRTWQSVKVSTTNPAGDPISRMNIEYPDRIEKWYAVGSDGQEWAPHLDADDVVMVAAEGEDDEADAIMPARDSDGAPVPLWPIPWTMDGTPEGEPIGIRIVHFTHAAHGDHYGRSLVKRAIPFQEELRKQLLDLMEVMDGQGWPQRWASGVGQTDSFKVAHGEYLKLPDGAKAGQFDAADPDPMGVAIERTLARFALCMRMPRHMLSPSLTGTLPSGESLKTAFASFTKAIEAVQLPTGNRWARVQSLGYRVCVAFGDGPPTVTMESQTPNGEPGTAEVTVILGPDDVIDVQWFSPEPRNEATEATTAESRNRLGVSKHTLVNEMGYDADAEAEQVREEAQAGATAAVDAFNAGKVA